MPIDRIVLRLPRNALKSFIPLLGAGVGIQTPLGIRLQELLCDRLGIPQAYLQERIQTIFVNGRAVDRPEEIVIGRDAVIALSAAMPGLAGATLRRGGFFAAMRREISQRDAGTETSGGEGRITLKLFNMLAPEMGDRILQGGVWLTAQRFIEFWREKSGELLPAALQMRCNDTLVDAEQARYWVPEAASVRLEVAWR